MLNCSNIKITIRSVRSWVMVMMLYIVVCPSELFAKTERYYYPIFAFVLLVLFLSRNNGRLKYDSIGSLIVFSIYGFISCTWSPTQDVFSFYAIKMVAVIFLILQLQFEFTEEEYETLKTALIIQMLFVGLVCIVFGKIDWDGRIVIRGNGTTTDGNSFVSWVIMPIAIIIGRLFGKSGKRLFYAICLAVAMVIVFWSGSRAGVVCSFLCVLGCVVVALKDKIRQSKIKAILVFLVGGMLIAFGLYMLPSSVIARFGYSNVAQLGGRTEIWSSLFNVMKNDWVGTIFGFGENATVYYTGFVAHSLFIEVLFNQGIVGLILFLFFFFKTFRKAKNNDVYIAVGFVCLSIMAASLSEFASRPLMLGLFFSLITVNKRNIVECGKG